MSSAQCRLLVAWYEKNARDLPWRRTHEPYVVWISEIMLQQTQVKTVLPRFATWFERFPDITSLATVSLDDVLKAWEGLGYYRRARFLHTAAQRIVSQHEGQFPQAFDDIVALPGIGRSTAGAIASFCFGAHTPVLDGNVKRVLRRWYTMPEATEKDLWARAQQAIDQIQNPALWNQAMMELGATVCSPNTPDCSSCPVSRQCPSAFGTVETARPGKATKVMDVHWRVTLHLHPEKGIWLTRRPASGIWAELWTPPIIELDEPPAQEPTHVHLLTHRRLHLYGEALEAKPSGNGQWVSDITKFALPTGIHRLLKKYEVET
ncbi:MAG: hypothetical protein BMS9Abin18_1512 [Zetaproteobacteria bacterium]|nr:MAG: hypothetical protein BMS9Abin18_1512 [Zetaproteobacteria bacterium]